MQQNEDGDLTIQIPPTEASHGDRTKGTFGGRQRWISGGNNAAESKVPGTNVGGYSTPRRGLLSTKAKIAPPSVQSFLSSMGIAIGEETQLVEKEIDEVSSLRRDYDTCKNFNSQKEMEIKKLEEEISNMSMTLNGRMQDSNQAKNQANNILNKSNLYESKLEEEMSDRSVYTHMIERLSAEAMEARKMTMEKEQALQGLRQDTTLSTSTLMSARREKSNAELAFKKIYENRWEQKQESIRALDAMRQAVDQTKLQYDILEQREVSRKQYVADALGAMRMRESKRLRHESSTQMMHFSELQDELSTTDGRLTAIESEFKQLVVAAGTNEVERIIAKHQSRETTLKNLEEEHAVADTKLRRLKERHKDLNSTLVHLRSAAVNSRTIYQEMDKTAEQLKDIDKEAMSLSTKVNRSSLAMDTFRSCMVKCLAKLHTIQGSSDFDEPQEDRKAIELPTPELLQVVEHKLNRVMDVINREKAERELHRSESNTGGAPDTPGFDIKSRTPAPTESEEHFILRMSQPDTSPANVRVRPKSRGCLPMPSPVIPASPPKRNDTSHDEEETIEIGKGQEDEPVIGRQMRKKLTGLVVSKSKRGKRATTPQTSH